MDGRAGDVELEADIDFEVAAVAAIALGGDTAPVACQHSRKVGTGPTSTRTR